MPQNRVLAKMLERLYASMGRSPALNCKPHSSRQRIDLTQFASFQDLTPSQVLRSLLSESRRVDVAAQVSPPPDEVRDSRRFRALPGDDRERGQTDDDPAKRPWRRQRSLLNKLRALSDDARTYEQDTGVGALYVGYPMLSMPPGGGVGSRPRVLAPMALIPVVLTTRIGQRPGVTLACGGDGADLVVANHVLVAALERQVSEQAFELSDEEAALPPWDEIRLILERMTAMLQLDVAASAFCHPDGVELQAVPKAEDLPDKPVVLSSAVLGLYPLTHQSLLRDMKELQEVPQITGPLSSFIDFDVSIAPDVDAQQADGSIPTVPPTPRSFATERLIALADPCQRRTVQLARTSRGLVIHGPPGTGKSQTISNIIGDHLVRGERVLFVCDKRTALDVVHHRLVHAGLDELCALVHDPHRDRQNLYMSMRAQLDALTDLKCDGSSARQLSKLDDDLQHVHEELTRLYQALMSAPDGEPSFHELAGQWLTLPHQSLDDQTVWSATQVELKQHEQDIEVAVERALKVGYGSNPWVHAAGLTLEKFLSLSMPQVRQALASMVEDGRTVDLAAHELVPKFQTGDLTPQNELRTRLLDQLERLLPACEPRIAQRVVGLEQQQLAHLLQQIAAMAQPRELLQQGPLDAELTMVANELHPKLSALGRQIQDLDQLTQSLKSWLGFLQRGVRQRGAAVLGPYGLSPNEADIKRLREFLVGYRARLLLSNLLAILHNQEPDGQRQPDDLLRQQLEQFDLTLSLRADALADEVLHQAVVRALVDADAAHRLCDGLKRSARRAAALQQFEDGLNRCGWFAARWLVKVSGGLRQGKRLGDIPMKLADALATLEDVVRIRHTLSNLPSTLRPAVEELLGGEAEPALVIATLRRAVLTGELSRRIQHDKTLHGLDAQRIANSFERYVALDDQKQALVRDLILSQWRQKQQQRLLAGTKTRLNSDGAKLKQRLFIKGPNALRLRQMVAVGAPTQGGDPLFDVRPVWMASPETVAQIFPREPLFDVVIFDEASQCKLEEALPVLCRAKRVVVAGDPKQLPPTRFFETGVVASEDDSPEDEHDLFEAQQSEVEDLLTAALNLDIEQAYLDVHYRSRNADLIQFSNHSFYNGRLQPIPGHPKNRTPVPPLRLDRVKGLYEDRINVPEAERVVQIVDELLRRAQPPSIGIACFNLVQRDLINELLEERAADDPVFASRLAVARQRRGDNSFENLIVRNLENVQGEERDHMIISTTYGPDARGRFFRRFGPLGRAGGGRRLNVLVTRARQEVHLVTSVPREVYAAAEPLPQGTQPNGAWLLFEYLRYAERLESAYSDNNRLMEEIQQVEQGVITKQEIAPFSDFSLGVAQALQQRRQWSSRVHWGNEGFRVDVALQHPQRPQDVTLGLLCDFARYDKAFDPVEWDAFRTAIHQSQGWQLRRVWSPCFFRDAHSQLDQIETEIQSVLSSEIQQDAP
jgi:hypothetical protein